MIDFVKVRSPLTEITSFVAVFAGALLILAAIPAGGTSQQPVLQPLLIQDRGTPERTLEVRLEPAAYMALKSAPPSTLVKFPISRTEHLTLELERLHIVTPEAKFYRGTPDGNVEMDPPDVVAFHGRVAEQPHSHVYLAFTGRGSGNGYVTTAEGETYYMARPPTALSDGEETGIVIHKATGSAGYPEFEEFCRAIMPEEGLPEMTNLRMYSDTIAGPRVSEVGFECDQRYCQIFDNLTEAQEYVLQLLGAVSSIYIRDVDMKLMISFLRLWPDGGEPFGAEDLYQFRDWWRSHEDVAGFNLVHMLSGRRDLGYGGIGFVGGTCGGGAAFAITAYINGSFPLPLQMADVGNWDVNCVAHEMGHNFYGQHTHSDYFWPHIDDCGNGVWAHSTILSYCHVQPGVGSNVDMRFHRGNQEIMEYWGIADGDCYWYDCNNNGAKDAYDILHGISEDVNSNGIPDECEDCNDNGIFDDIDIAGSSQDFNGNGIPDECEEDCNGNSYPDEIETFYGISPDENGNCVPDECEPDCNDNGVADFLDIRNGLLEDWDNNNVPDICQDCDDNGIADMIDLGREFNMYVCNAEGFIREYNAVSALPIQNLGSGSLSSPMDCVFGPDRQLYVANLGNSSIVRLNVDSNTTSTFVASGSGGLDMPMFLIFGPDDNLYVSSWNNSRILRFDGSTGAFIDTFVTPGSGGLSYPMGLIFGPNGNLFVANGDNSVLEFSSTDGSSVGTFVSAGSSNLNGARGIAFAPDGKLLVCSYSGHSINQYDGATGAYLGIFNDDYPPLNPWGLKIGPNGNVFVAQTAEPIWIREYIYPKGINTRRIVRNDPGLTTPNGLAFRPIAASDADGNYILDICDVCVDSDGDGYGDPGNPGNTCYTDNCPSTYNPDQKDTDYDGIGDACDDCPYDPYNDVDGDGLCGDIDNCPTIPNVPQDDIDGDGIGDLCDNCISDPNPRQQDSDLDFVGNECDNCPYVVNPNQDDTDGDDAGNACDNCPETVNPYQEDGDMDSAGDSCDNCIAVFNPDQEDYDSDSVGDSCDNCIYVYNPGQEDLNDNGTGDVCEYICGDANGDEAINIVDVTFIINYLYKDGPPPDPEQAADADGSGGINLLDATHLINYLYKEGPDPICE